MVVDFVLVVFGTLGFSFPVVAVSAYIASCARKFRERGASPASAQASDQEFMLGNGHGASANGACDGSSVPDTAVSEETPLLQSLALCSGCGGEASRSRVSLSGEILTIGDASQSIGQPRCELVVPLGGLEVSVEGSVVALAARTPCIELEFGSSSEASAWTAQLKQAALLPSAGVLIQDLLQQLQAAEAELAERDERIAELREGLATASRERRANRGSGTR